MVIKIIYSNHLIALSAQPTEPALHGELNIDNITIAHEKTINIFNAPSQFTVFGFSGFTVSNIKIDISKICRIIKIITALYQPYKLDDVIDIAVRVIKLQLPISNFYIRKFCL